MSELSFLCNFKSSELQSLALPVEVRKPNLALVAQTLTTRSVNLEPGLYYVTARLPAGQELFNQVTISEDSPSTVILTPEPEDVSPNESLEVESYITGSQTTSWTGSGSSLEGLGAENVTAKLRAFSGNILLGQLSERNDQSWLVPLSAPSIGVAKFSVPAGNVTLVQLLQPKVPPINMALPISPFPPQNGCQLVLTRQSDGLISVDIHLEHITADMLLGYFLRGLLDQAVTITTSNALQAEQLLDQKLSYPIAAAVGAYALLRFGDLDRLHNWTENLNNWFTWLPDGAAIGGEHLARLGKHKEALPVFLELPSRGLPIFSDGLSYAIDRLRLYTTADNTHFDPSALSQAQSLLKDLKRFIAFVDFRKPLLTFSGIDASKPDDRPLGEDIEDFEGLDVAQYLA